MHLYVVARGQIDMLNRYINDLSARYYKYRYKKGVPKGDIQLAVRPVQLLEIVFPEEHLQDILAVVPVVDTKRLKPFTKTLRKLLKLKPVPERKRTDMIISSVHRHVALHGIGIKEDEKDKDGIEML